MKITQRHNNFQANLYKNKHSRVDYAEFVFVSVYILGYFV